MGKWQRGVALLLTLCLHLFGYLSVWSQHLPRPAAVLPALQIVFLAAEPAPVLPVAALTPVPLQASHSAKPAKPAKSAKPSKAVQSEMAAVPQAAAVVAAPVDSLAQKSLRDVGAIDRQLRQESGQKPGQERRPLPHTAPLSAQQKMAAGIAAAARPRGTSTEEIVQPNGIRYTKVTTPFGSYCVFRGSAGYDMGHDQMQRGIRSWTSDCPN